MNGKQSLATKTYLLFNSLNCTAGPSYFMLGRFVIDTVNNSSRANSYVCDDFRQAPGIFIYYYSLCFPVIFAIDGILKMETGFDIGV